MSTVLSSMYKVSEKVLTRETCRNVLVVAITPRNEDRQVNLKGAYRNVRYLIENGIDFIMPACGTGQGYDTSLEEFEAVVGTFMDAAKGQAVIVPGIGPGFGRCKEMGCIARSLDVAGVMIMPIVGPASNQGVFNGLKIIAEETKLPSILYQRRLDIMPVDDVVRLCEIDNIIGLKYSVDDIVSFRELVDGASDRVAMVCGMAEDPCIEYMENGAIGFSSGMGNFVPRMSLMLLNKFQSGDLKEANRLRELMLPFENFRGERGARYSTSALHSAMDCFGLSGGPVIPFSEDVASGDLPRVKAMMKVLGKEEKKLKEENKDV